MQWNPLKHSLNNRSWTFCKGSTFRRSVSCFFAIENKRKILDKINVASSCKSWHTEKPYKTNTDLIARFETQPSY
jgi:hypothetical protein